MKLRSRTKAVLKVEKDVLRKGENKVPQILPATEAMYVHPFMSSKLQQLIFDDVVLQATQRRHSSNCLKK